MASMLSTSCSRTAQRAEADDDFNYHVERFADIEVLRYKVPDFDSLSLNQKILVYYLTEAALWGRDILWDQNTPTTLLCATSSRLCTPTMTAPRKAPITRLSTHI